MARRVILLFAGVVLLAGLLAAGAAWWGLRWLDMPGPADADVRVEIPPGSSLGAVAARLESAGAVDDARLFRWYGQLSGTAPRVRAGEYDIPAGSTPRAIMALLVSGDVVMHSVTIVEGWTFREMRNVLETHPALRAEAAGLEAGDIMERLGRPGVPPEGWFLPETYRFPRGTSDLEIMALAHDAMETALETAWAARDADVPLETPYEALILASIVEKETGLPSERARVAGVFTRRLKMGMRLQTDPTVIYGLGESFDGNLRRRDLETDNPYNTYTRAGLPPTPIALPGRAALEAATRPAEGDALYFVATGKGDGSHYFSATLEEHNEAVRRYLRRLREGRDGN
ncbi:MAG: endolytic transglycosylase MltG [Gammaproteobacteria bacterium]